MRSERPAVLHVLEAFAGGTERHVLDLVRHVPVVEHVLAVPPRHLGLSTAPQVARARALGARVELIQMPRAPLPHRALQGVVGLRRLIARTRPALVHAHSSVGGALGRLAAIGTGVPVIYTPNGLSRSRWALAIERALSRRTDWFVAVSPSEGQFALAHRLTRPERLSVIPNGIELDPPMPMRPPLRTTLGIPADAELVGCLGRLTRQKAPEVYVRACVLASRQRPAAHYVLIGSGPRRSKVERVLRGAPPGFAERFHWLDALPDASAAFAELDLYVLPSRFEGGPYTPLEAMRVGTPVVLTDADGNRDTVEHDVSGVLVPVDDADALGRVIAELLADGSRRAAIGRAGRERLTSRFDVRAMGNATGGLYEELTSVA